MCNCVTSWDLINKINEKRAKRGLEEINYAFLMYQHRNKWRFHKPVRTIGCSLVWDRKTANKIVSILWDLPYRSTFRWAAYAA